MNILFYLKCSTTVELVSFVQQLIGKSQRVMMAAFKTQAVSWKQAE